jgi:hypothetical protein
MSATMEEIQAKLKYWDLVFGYGEGDFSVELKRNHMCEVTIFGEVRLCQYPEMNVLGEVTLTIEELKELIDLKENLWK